MSTDPNINKVLGGKVKALRNEKKITREALAEQIEISARFLADVEVGKVGISLATLKRICIALGVSADYLLGIAPEDGNASEYAEIETRLKQIDVKYLPYFKDLVQTFIGLIETHKKA